MRGTDEQSSASLARVCPSLQHSSREICSAPMDTKGEGEEMKRRWTLSSLASGGYICNHSRRSGD